MADQATPNDTRNCPPPEMESAMRSGQDNDVGDEMTIGEKFDVPVEGTHEKRVAEADKILSTGEVEPTE